MHAGPVVLEHDVGREREARAPLALRRILEVEHDRALVAVHRREVLAERASVSRTATAAAIAEAVAAVGRLDLDHVGAHVGQQHPAERAGGDLAELDDLDALEREHEWTDEAKLGILADRGSATTWTN